MFQQQINKIKTLLNFSKCRFFQKIRTLPPDNKDIKFTCFPFVDMLKLLFFDPNLNQHCNLATSNSSDPFLEYKSPNRQLGEVKGRQWYHQTYDLMI